MKKYLQTFSLIGMSSLPIGSISQREALVELLDKMEAEDEIIYGLHISNASVMSCYVRDLKDGHIRFVDGSEGGYTKAAKMLKAKLKF